MKPSDPLTVEEVQVAADRFFPLFDVVLRSMPEGSKIEDCLKVMETVATLAHKIRAEDKQNTPLGFNKLQNDESTPSSTTFTPFGGTS